MIGDKGIDLFVTHAVRTRLDFATAIGRKGRLLENLARQADTGAHIHPVVGIAHIVEEDFGFVMRVCAPESDIAPAL